MTTNAREIFLQSEGDAWFLRNQGTKHRNYSDDRIVRSIATLPNLPRGAAILEIGCGGGERLHHLQREHGFKCSGIEPGASAVAHAKSLSIDAIQGTAEELPFSDRNFDIVIFGFCLYLCDRQDLFRIAAEADRVLKAPGWLVIFDFYSEHPWDRPYHHKPAVRSHKMDYRTLFSWHPAYTCFSQDVRHHELGSYTDDANEWVALSVIRKKEFTDLT